jgi:hypothetical protein
MYGCQELDSLPLISLSLSNFRYKEKIENGGKMEGNIEMKK